MFGWGDDQRESGDQHCRELPRFSWRAPVYVTREKPRMITCRRNARVQRY